VFSDRVDVQAVGRQSIGLPGGLVEWVAPVPNIVPGQLLALALAGRGLDPERPPSLSTVTLTN
jgi:glutamine---fructose-6-phosphate transaminase (isomerizing)